MYALKLHYFMHSDSIYNNKKIHLFQGEETLKVYLQKYSEDEVQRIIQHPVKRIEFCKILKERPQDNSEEIIEIADQKLRENFEILKII